jgi:SET domain-containing protein
MFKEPRSSYPSWFLSKEVEITESPVHGLGCFAKEKIPANVLIESCPVIIFHRDTLDVLADEYEERHALMEYPFTWKTGYLAFCLGYGGIYNHSTKNPNVTWRPNHELPSMEYYTRRDIEVGEELFVRYHPYSDSGKLWFPDEDGDEGEHLAVRTAEGKFLASSVVPNVDFGWKIKKD